MAKRRRRNPGGGLFGRVTTRDLVIVGLIGGVVYAMTRKPLQTESRVTVDWTSGLRRDLEAFIDRRAGR